MVYVMDTYSASKPYVRGTDWRQLSQLIVQYGQKTEDSKYADDSKI